MLPCHDGLARSTLDRSISRETVSSLVMIFPIMTLGDLFLSDCPLEGLEGLWLRSLHGWYGWYGCSAASRFSNNGGREFQASRTSFWIYSAHMSWEQPEQDADAMNLLCSSLFNDVLRMFRNSHCTWLPPRTAHPASKFAPDRWLSAERLLSSQLLSVSSMINGCSWWGARRLRAA